MVSDIPFGRNVLRLSKCDWFTPGWSATFFLTLQTYGVSLGLRMRYLLHANFRANKLQANFLGPKCRKLEHFNAVSVRHMT